MDYSKYDDDAINRMIYARKGACIRVEKGVAALITPDEERRTAEKYADESMQECVDYLWRTFSPQYSAGEDMLDLLLDMKAASVARFAHALVSKMDKKTLQRLVCHLWLQDHE